jgi:transcriptional antiterminator RfaH
MESLASSWYAIRTKPRQEERAVGNLAAQGALTFFPHFLSSKFPFVHPLFMGYIFVYCDLESMFSKIRFTRGLSYVVCFGGKPAVIEPEIIELIRARTDKNGVCQPIPTLLPGEAVVVHSGPLRDLKGVFERDLPDGERVRILLSTIAYSAHVDIARSEVAKAS